MKYNEELKVWCCEGRVIIPDEDLKRWEYEHENDNECSCL